MAEIIAKLLPTLLTFLLGIALKKVSLLKKQDAGLLMKLVFNVSLPALILLSFSTVRLSGELIYLPVIAVITIGVTGLVSFAACRVIKPARTSMGTAMIGSMIMNIGFLYPFIMAVYGPRGFALAVMFDFGNGFLVLTFIYYIACRYSNTAISARSTFRQLAMSPPLWALAAAVCMNVFDLQIPVMLTGFIETIGNLTLPLIMLSLGIFFTPKLLQPPLFISVLCIRSAAGLACGLLLANLFELPRLPFSIAILCASAPVGFNTLVFSSQTRLDVELAAGLVSISAVSALIYVPFLMSILS